LTFQPFGYRFELSSISPAEAVKARIRSRLKPWLDPKGGVRGWIAGPIICLWEGAYRPRGPMLLGRISGKELGTKIGGRAGSDLNGLAMLLFLVLVAIPASIFLGDIGRQEFVIVAGLILLTPLALYFHHSDRGEAEPLVRFLREILENRTERGPVEGPALPAEFTLIADGEESDGLVSAGTIRAALADLREGGFAILESAPDVYVQAALLDGGFILEKREGYDGRHFRAVHQTKPAPSGGDGSRFSQEEVEATFLAFASGEDGPDFMRWERAAFGS
jgi:hypothetical protein